MNNAFYLETITEVCEKEGITFKFLSYGWILQLKKDGKTRYVVGTNSGLNTSASSKIVGDKYACYEVLKDSNIPIIEHFIMFNPKNTGKHKVEEDEWPLVIKYFKDNNHEVVVKPNDGMQGNNVFRCTSINGLRKAVRTIFKEKYSLTICPFYDYEYEYRVFFVNDKCAAAYGKVKPYVIGNGEDTVISLIKQKYESVEINPDPHLKIDFNTYIPNLNEKVIVSWKHNLSKGAEAFLVEDKTQNKRLYDLAKKAAEVVNIKTATIDIIELSNGELLVIEINSSIATSGFIKRIPAGKEIAKEIYQTIIRDLFKQG